MKPGDKFDVVIDGVEYELWNNGNQIAPYIKAIAPKPQKCELEKLVTAEADRMPQSQYSIGYSTGMWEGARALLEYLDKQIEQTRDLGGGYLCSLARKWCGK